MVCDMILKYICSVDNVLISSLYFLVWDYDKYKLVRYIMFMLFTYHRRKSNLQIHEIMFVCYLISISSCWKQGKPFGKAVQFHLGKFQKTFPRPRGICDFWEIEKGAVGKIKKSENTDSAENKRTEFFKSSEF